MLKMIDHPTEPLTERLAGVSGRLGAAQFKLRFMADAVKNPSLAADLLRAADLLDAAETIVNAIATSATGCTPPAAPATLRVKSLRSDAADLERAALLLRDLDAAFSAAAACPTIVIDDTLAKLGAFVRDRRTRAAMTLDDLATATGISKAYLSLLERGRVQGLRDAKFRAIERELKLPAGSLVARADLIRLEPSVRAMVTRLAGGATDASADF